MRLARLTSLAALALGLLASPLAAEAQQTGKVYRVGMLETSWLVPAGAPANVVTPTWRGTIDAEIEVIGDAGTGRIRLLDAPLSFWSAGFTAAPETGLWPEVSESIGGALQDEDAHFIDRVRRGAPESIASVADAVMGLRVAEAIVAAASSETVVELDSHV